MASNRTMAYKNPVSEPIAIVGASCRFAGGATTPSHLWELLVNPTDLTREIPAERFNIKVSHIHPPIFYPASQWRTIVLTLS
jgi:hypothetical protein